MADPDNPSAVGIVDPANFRTGYHVETFVHGNTNYAFVTFKSAVPHFYGAVCDLSNPANAAVVGVLTLFGDTQQQNSNSGNSGYRSNSVTIFQHAGDNFALLTSTFPLLRLFYSFYASLSLPSLPLPF